MEPLPGKGDVERPLTVPGWRRTGDRLCCGYAARDEQSAAAFVGRMAAAATTLQCPPEWRHEHGRIELSVPVHGAGDAVRIQAFANRLAAIADELGVAPATAPAAAVRVDNLWVPPGHYYSPLPDAAELAADAARLFAPGQRNLHAIDLGLDRQLANVHRLLPFYGEEDFAETPRDDRRYCLANEYFPYGDAFTYYALLRLLRPRRVIEVGVGWSSAVLLDTDERFLQNGTACTFIDPYPERLLALLRPADDARTRLLPMRLQDVPLAEFEALEQGDILFLDSTHVVKTGSDVNHAVFEVLPRLASGVWVHFHDIHANFEYPQRWIAEGRAWNEAYLLRAFLMHNADWTIELHGATLATVAADQLLPLLPRIGQNVGASLWLKKC